MVHLTAGTVLSEEKKRMEQVSALRYTQDAYLLPQAFIELLEDKQWIKPTNPSHHGSYWKDRFTQKRDKAHSPKVVLVRICERYPRVHADERNAGLKGTSPHGSRRSDHHSPSHSFI